MEHSEHIPDDVHTQPNPVQDHQAGTDDAAQVEKLRRRVAELEEGLRATEERYQAQILHEQEARAAAERMCSAAQQAQREAEQELSHERDARLELERLHQEEHEGRMRAERRLAEEHEARIVAERERDREQERRGRAERERDENASLLADERARHDETRAERDQESARASRNGTAAVVLGGSTFVSTIGHLLRK